MSSVEQGAEITNTAVTPLGQVLVVDDEVEFKNSLLELLNTHGYQAVGYGNREEALTALSMHTFDVMLTDLIMPGIDGISLLQASLEFDPNLVCIVMTGQKTIQAAVDAMRVGAFDYVLKPFRLQTILPILTRAMNTRRLKLENLQLRETMLLNLIVNARDAMPQGGKLTIETANVILSDEHAQRHAATSGAYAMFAVSDSGCGMDSEIREHIFEPFFTTKGAGKGTGLGLSTVYGIVKQSGGHVWLYSEPNKGTTFKVYLPLANEAQEQQEIRMGTRAIPKGTETVLLVEDEDSVRSILTDILETQGYHVIVASNGMEGLKIAATDNVTIHLMVTDVVMPQMSGRELAEQVTEIRPDMKILYMSGYTDDAIVRHGLLDEKLKFPPKAF